MEDKSVRYIVYIIIFVILSIIGLTIFFIVNKINNSKVKQADIEENHTYESIKCSKTTEGDIERKEDLELIYQDKDVYEFKMTYTYTYKYETEKNKTLSELNTIYSKEVEFDSEHIKSKYEDIEKGGITTVTYNLTDQDVRMYVNSKFFNYNMYQPTTGLKQYLTNSKNYTCE